MSTEALSRLICGICHDENLQEVGELDSCDHSFCVKCILQWSKIESRCPFCKARFSKVLHKQLDLTALPAPDSGRVSEVFPGTVLEEHIIPERNQRVADDEMWGQARDPMDDVFCDGCGEGDHEDQIVLCDGCDHGWHTYCAGLEEVPAGQWFCPSCFSMGPAAALRRRARNMAIDDPVTPEMRQGMEMLRNRVRQLTGSLRVMRDVAPGASQPVEAATRAACTRSRGRGTRRVFINRREEVSDDSSSSEEETSSETSRQQRAEGSRRSLRRRREEDPDELDFRETTPSQRLPTPHRARPRTRTGGAHAARQSEAARPNRRRRTEQSAPQPASADALLPPSRAHRNVEELRARWEAIRQGQVDFGGQPTAAEEEDEEDSESSEEESDSSEEKSGGSQNMPLSDRFTAISRARAALDRNWHIRALNLARRTGQLLPSEERRQAAFRDVRAARDELLRRRQLHNASARPHQGSEQAEKTPRQQGAHAASARPAVPSRASILAEQLMDNGRRSSVTHQSRLAAARANQQEGQVRSPEQHGAKLSAPIRPSEDGSAAHRSPGRLNREMSSHNMAESLAIEGRRTNAEVETRRRENLSLQASPVVTAESDTRQRRETQVAEAAREKLAQTRPIPAAESGRTPAVALQGLPNGVARTMSEHRAESRSEEALAAPVLAPRGPQPQMARPVSPSALSRWQRRPAGTSQREGHASAANSLSGRTAGALPQGSPLSSETPNWQWSIPDSVQPPAGWQPPPYSGWASSSYPPGLIHPGSQPPAAASPKLPSMPPPPSLIPAAGILPSGAKQSSWSRSRWNPALHSSEGSGGPAQLRRPFQEGSRDQLGAVSGVSGSRLSERMSKSDSDASENSSPGKFEPGRRTKSGLSLASSKYSQAEESARLKEKKISAYRAVKAFLDPLYKKGRLTSEEYKQAARDATHRLYKGSSEPNEANWQADAERAVKKVMKRSRT